MEEIKRAIARLDGEGGDIATAFLVSPKYMLTSKHIFVSNPDISTYKICFPNYDKDKEYTIDEISFDDDISIELVANDIAIIKLNEPAEGIQPLNLDFSSVKDEEKWISYGFPSANRDVGDAFKGTVRNVFIENTTLKYNINLNCEKPQIIDGYGVVGASGSPIILNAKVVAIFSNVSQGATIGASSLCRSKALIEKNVANLELIITESPLQKSIREAIFNTERFIEGFSDELQDFLRKELHELQHEYTDRGDEIKFFLDNSKYPIATEGTIVNGIEATLEILLMVRSMYGNLRILMNDDFANLQVTSDKNYNLSFVYAQDRNQMMPEILLKMHNQMIGKSAAQIMIECGKSIPPNPTIMDNCNSSLRYNLCNSCGQNFKFGGILQTYIENEDDGLIKGIVKNNFASLNEAKVICGDCVRKVRDQVEGTRELKGMVVEKIYG